jgi:hypothetical protein
MAAYTTTADAVAAIKAHSVCALYMETPGSFVVYYPASYVVPGGASVPRGLNELDSLNRLYDLIDQFWNAQTLQISAQ